MCTFHIHSCTPIHHTPYSIHLSDMRHDQWVPKWICSNICRNNIWFFTNQSSNQLIDSFVSRFFFYNFGFDWNRLIKPVECIIIRLGMNVGNDFYARAHTHTHWSKRYNRFKSINVLRCLAVSDFSLIFDSTTLNDVRLRDVQVFVINIISIEICTT